MKKTLLSITLLFCSGIFPAQNPSFNEMLSGTNKRIQHFDSICSEATASKLSFRKNCSFICYNARDSKKTKHIIKIKYREGNIAAVHCYKNGSGEEIMVSTLNGKQMMLKSYMRGKGHMIETSEMIRIDETTWLWVYEKVNEDGSVYQHTGKVNSP